MGGQRERRVKYSRIPGETSEGCQVGLWVPEQLEGDREQQLVVDGDAHIARLVEGRGHRLHRAAQGAAPAQEEQLGCGREPPHIITRDNNTHHASGGLCYKGCWVN